jgi:hypothetical protein
MESMKQISPYQPAGHGEDELSHRLMVRLRTHLNV